MASRGFIQFLILIIIGIIALSYFHFDLRGVLQSDLFHQNLSYLSDISQKIWQQYLSYPFTYVFNYIWQHILSLGHNLTNSP